MSLNLDSYSILRLLGFSQPDPASANTLLLNFQNSFQNPNIWAQYPPGPPVLEERERQCLDYFQCVDQQRKDFEEASKYGTICFYVPRISCTPPKFQKEPEPIQTQGKSRFDILAETLVREATSPRALFQMYFNETQEGQAVKGGAFSAVAYGLSKATALREVEHWEAVDACQAYPNVRPFIKP